METTDFGTIQIRAFEASEALPIQNATVKITGSDEYNRDIQISQLTDSDGMTKAIPLPAPPANLSMSPGAVLEPYSVFDVEIVKDGYYPKRIFNVPIFAGIKAMLPIEMLPLTYNKDGSIIQLKGLNSIIYENENLN